MLEAAPEWSLGQWLLASHQPEGWAELRRHLAKTLQFPSSADYAHFWFLSSLCAIVPETRNKGEKSKR